MSNKAQAAWGFSVNLLLDFAEQTADILEKSLEAGTYEKDVQSFLGWAKQRASEIQVVQNAYQALANWDGNDLEELRATLGEIVGVLPQEVPEVSLSV